VKSPWVQSPRRRPSSLWSVGQLPTKGGVEETDMDASCMDQRRLLRVEKWLTMTLPRFFAGRRRTIRGACFVVAWWLADLVAAAPAFAQGDSAATTTTPVATTSNPVLTGSDLLFATVFLCIFGVAVVAGVLLFTRDSTQSFYKVLEKLSALGRSSQVVEVETFDVPAPADPAVASADAASPASISGPASLAVGQAGIYDASVNGTAAPSAWTVNPPAAAAVNPTKDGSTASVVPAIAGIFTLTAAPTQAGAKSSAFSIAAVPATANGVQLPLLGQAWGTLLIVVVLLIVVLIAALAGVFTSALATLAGGVLGYVFTGHAASTTTGTTNSQGGSGGNGGSNPASG
jgi:hypothetical protein